MLLVWLIATDEPLENYPQNEAQNAHSEPHSEQQKSKESHNAQKTILLVMSVVFSIVCRTFDSFSCLQRAGEVLCIHSDNSFDNGQTFRAFCALE